VTFYDFFITLDILTCSYYVWCFTCFLSSFWNVYSLEV